MSLVEQRNSTTSWIVLGLLVISLLLAIGFFLGFALPYLLLDDEVLKRFDGRQFWIITHVATGSVALLIGPFQLWMGFTGNKKPIHRRLGMIYLISIGISSLCSFYLAATTQVTWILGAGLAGLGLAWVITGSLAYIAIRRRLYQQHMEWMVRSYVVTLGFVFFRIFVGITGAFDIGTLFERLSAASWFCWAVPLLITEAILQWRKMVKSSAHA
ncbi:DUF2306 domain-containing protein [Neptuniibacter sp.]|uniref:DUF2306 domain-containing protein n=1 Tax=Neptuniibacter sp. TaxID=1962643 RepID=UPI003B59C1A4